MLILLSPAKSLDFETNFNFTEYTLPFFQQETIELISILKNLSAKDLANLMKISEKLANLNYQRFQNFSRNFNKSNSKQAILAFNGDVYDGIDKKNYNKEDFIFAQNHVRILSGLYGILKPLDLIQPYRLEMGTDFKKINKGNLYQFWDNKITNFLNDEIKLLKNKIIVNLASNEYFSAVNLKSLKSDVINIVFKEKNGDIFKIIGINSKKARGLMTNFAIKNKITNPQELKDFKEENYSFNEKLSNNLNYIFTR